MIGRFPETQSSRGGGGSGLQGVGADPGPAPELPRAVKCPKPSSERKHDNDGDVSALPERRRRIWRPLAKPKEARNFKDLKGLKSRYTFGIRALCCESPIGKRCLDLLYCRLQRLGLVTLIAGLDNGVNYVDYRDKTNNGSEHHV